MSKLTARWMWFDTDRTEEVFARARRSFELDEVPPDAAARITCSGHYRLFVNGSFAGRGPARSNPQKKRYDTLDVAPFLRTGRNVLAVQLIHYGYRTAQVPEGPGGFWFELDAGPARIESDEDWRVSLDPAYATGTGRRNGCYGPIEIYDARLEEDWTEPALDDSGWSRARVLRDRHGPGPRVSPWTDLVPRPIPRCRESEFRPEAVVHVGEVEDQEFLMPTLAGQLLQDVPVESEHTSIENADALVSDAEGPAVVRQPSPLDRDRPERRCATLILDFGREITAYGWLEVEGNAGAVIDVAYGERLVAGRVQAVVQDVHYADRYILKAGRQRHEVYDWKGYRYVQLTFRELTEPLRLHGVGATVTSYPLDAAGRFESSDALLDRVWRTGATTQQLCTHDSVMDCPWREQQQWLGDGRVQVLVLQNAFGEAAMPRSFVGQFAEAQQPSGLLPCCVPGRENVIIDYALWWASALRDVLWFDGDTAFAGRCFPALARLLAWFDPHRNADGLLENVPGWTFVDWADVGREGICAALNATYATNLHAAADVAEATGHAPEAEGWRNKARLLAAAFHDAFWDDARELYADNVLGGTRTDRFSVHTQAAAVLAGLTQTDDADLLRRALGDETLVRPEPYFSFYLLEVLARAGLMREALDFVRRKWGAMLEAGATSFWEEWQVTGTFRTGRWTPRPRSHCHAWSAGPTAWLSRWVLGVRPGERPDDPPVVQPHPGDLERASGVVPTQHGPVTVAWEVNGDRFRVTVEAPDAAPVRVLDPPGFEGRTDITRT
jgi:hypothetical protein